MNSKGCILITDVVHENLIDGLRSSGFLVEYDPKLSREEVRSALGDYSGIVINTRMIMDAWMLERAQDLRFIARLGSGMEIVDIPRAEAMNIALIRCPEGNANAVGEHAMGMLLSLSNKLNSGDKQVRDFTWNREAHRGWELGGKTVGIIGYGHTGCNFAAKLAGFDVKVLAYDKYKKHFADEVRYVHEVTLEEVVERSDIISLHVPLTEDTLGMVNDHFLAGCKKGVILINTARGKVINTHALIEGLERGQVGAAALDVFENEKPTTMSDEERKMYERLFALENTIFSPHVGGWTYESKLRMANILLDRILALHWD